MKDLTESIRDERQERMKGFESVLDAIQDERQERKAEMKDLTESIRDERQERMKGFESVLDAIQDERQERKAEMKDLTEAIGRLDEKLNAVHNLNVRLSVVEKQVGGWVFIPPEESVRPAPGAVREASG